MTPQTPYLLIDEAVMLKNIRGMAAAATALGCRLRPHVKTHKVPEIAKLQLEAGACGVTVAKLGEAEVMAGAGIRDIFMAYPLVGEEKIRRAAALARRVNRLILAVDCMEGAAPLSDAAVQEGIRLEVRLEVDTGYGRTGAPYRQAPALARRIAALPGLRLSGLYTFKSNTLAGQWTDDLAAAGREEGELLVRLAAELGDLGPLELSGGSTPTGLHTASVPGVSEIRPGTYVFNDRMQIALGVCGPQECALRVVYTVVSAPEPGRIVLDGGSKSIACDVKPGAPPYNLAGYGLCPEDPCLLLERLTEEHGMARLLPGARAYRVGGTIGLIPNHVCPTVNLYDTAYVKSEGGLRELRVAARGKLG